MVKVAQRGRFSVYVYAEQGNRHHAAHCHVKWAEGEASVELIDRVVLAGEPLPAPARRLVEDFLDELRAAWDGLNPGREIRR